MILFYDLRSKIHNCDIEIHYTSYHDRSCYSYCQFRPKYLCYHRLFEQLWKVIPSKPFIWHYCSVLKHSGRAVSKDYDWLCKLTRTKAINTTVVPFSVFWLPGISFLAHQYSLLLLPVDKQKTLSMSFELWLHLLRNIAI